MSSNAEILLLAHVYRQNGMLAAPSERHPDQPATAGVPDRTSQETAASRLGLSVCVATITVTHIIQFAEVAVTDR